MIKTEYYKDLTKMNTFGMKVKARCFMEYDSVADLVDIEFGELARPVLHIGGGSNLLFTDDFKGTVLHSKINFIEILDDGHISDECQSASVAPAHDLLPQAARCKSPLDCLPTAREVGECHFRTNGTSSEESSSAVLVSVGAGVVFDDFCAWAAKEGLWGVENLSYIPGEVGASAVQNIGAYGVEVKDVIRTVYCYDTVEEEFVKFDVSECDYGYRHSIFKTPEVKGRYVVTHVVFALSRDPQPKLEYGHLREAVACHFERSDSGDEKSLSVALTPEMIRKVIIRIRKEKLPEPSVMGSAGSFFKNPVISMEHFQRIEAAAKAEHGPDYKVPHYVVDAPDLSRRSSAVLSASARCSQNIEAAAAPVSAVGGDGMPLGAVASATGGESRILTAVAVKIPAAWMIEQCGWKGRRSGGAAVWEKQPLVIVNYTGEAYPEEIVGLEKRIIASVKAKFGVELHPEVEHIY